MGFKQCEKCSEMVDEARAFCPGCGHAFVEEQQRSQISSFDTMDSTMQLGATMYNQMLSDMGLKTPKAPVPVEKRVEVIAPVAISLKTRKPEVDKSKVSGNKKWFILAGIAALLLFLLALAIAVLILIYWSRFS